MKKITLKEHRIKLSQCEDCFGKDIERVVDTFIKHMKSCGYYGVPDKLRKEIVSLIWEAQGKKPFYYSVSTDGLPLVWSRPADWPKHDYFRYEWGHLDSINQNGDSANYLENFALMTARGNQHIQTSLNIDEVLEFLEGSQAGNTAKKNITKRQKLFSSKAWKSLKKKLKPYQKTQSNKTNKELKKVDFVVDDFITGAGNSKSENVTYEKDILYSYALPIAKKINNRVFIGNYTKRKINGTNGKWYSKYTSEHVGRVIKSAKKNNKSFSIVGPKVFEDLGE